MAEEIERRQIKLKPAAEALEQKFLDVVRENKDLLRRYHLGGEPLSKEEEKQVTNVQDRLKYALLGDKYWYALDLTDEEKKQLGFS